MKIRCFPSFQNAAQENNDFVIHYYIIIFKE